MKLLIVFSLIAAASSTESFAQSTASAPELASEQIALIELFDACTGACNADRRYLGSRPVVMDVNGSQSFSMPVSAWSPDGKRILNAGSDFNAGSDIFLMPATGGTALNLTNHPARYTTPAWSPDGTRIAFASDRDGPWALYVMNADGSHVVPLNAGVAQATYPAWSPDSARLAFGCIVAATEDSDICVINADGTGFARLTDSAGNDNHPDWSPDGSRIVFDTDRYGDGAEIAIMAPGGGSLIRISPGVVGDSPRWSPDGTRLAFVNWIPYDDTDPYYPSAPYVTIMAADGTLGPVVAFGTGPKWRPFDAGSPNYRPSASFAFNCVDHTCSLDATSSSDSDGNVVSYGWQFDDGVASGAIVTHTFSSGHNVRLIVMDDRGALGTIAQSVDRPPIVSFSASCNLLTCTFDASASYDPDGAIELQVWRFGDGKDGTGPAIVSHTYSGPSTYIVTLTATDRDGAATTFSRSVTVSAPTPTPMPYRGIAATIPGTIEAEDFDEGGPNVAYADTTAGNSGGQYRGTDVDIEGTTDAGGGFNVGWIFPGEWLNYTVNVAAAGIYRLGARVASEGPGGTFHIEVGGAQLTDALTIPNTGGWQHWTDIFRNVTLPAGIHQLRVVMDTPGVNGAVGNLNSLVFTTVVPGPPPPGPTPYRGIAATIPGTIQAENFDDGGASVAYLDTTPGNSGNQYRMTDVDIEATTDIDGGYNVGWMFPGEWLTYTVNIAAAGTYTLDARVASEGPGGTFRIEVDEAAITGDLIVPDTGGWQHWTDIATTVTLPSGPHLLRVVMETPGASGAVGNLNYMLFRAR